ncbi:hypothetical protein [Pedobacter nutrimenti]|uniref:hypothetical protein n=1 Tax=Pedobacter nutrimenti TaxID=1241337 RepID=UPI00292E9CDE|nr:hypothetical protein [Pedobacter nutrimenti]
MRKILIGLALSTLIFISCNQKQQSKTADKAHDVPTARSISEKQIPTADEVSMPQSNDSLLYEGKSFSSYIDAEHRGAGVVSFTLEVNDRLDIWNTDDSKFGEIVLNEDFTFFTLNMPQKVIARKVVPEYDFAAFDFDAEEVATNKDYLIIYVNKEKRKVKKSEAKFTFSPWNVYFTKSGHFW